MVLSQVVSVGWLRFMTVPVVLLSAVLCLAAEPGQEQPEQKKAKTLREVAQNWIQVGMAQSKRGLYQQAEESFLAARDHQEYLTAEEHKKLEENLTKAHQAAVERRVVLRQIRIARALLDKGQPIKARAHYEKVRNSTFLTKQQRRQIAREIKEVDVNFDKQRKELTELYNRSVELYRAGELEKAREGFVEVARYGLLIAPTGQMAEDYLIQIDSILIERLKNTSSAEPVPPLALPVNTLPALEDKKTPRINQPTTPEAELEPLQTGAARQQEDSKQQTQRVQKETAEVTALAEPAPRKPAEAAPPTEAKTKIIRTYTKAVVEDAAAKVEYYITRGEFDKAVAAVRTATRTIKENRPFIGDELFTQYAIRLKQLADRIINARKTS